jgi:hypothetical protein
VLVLVTCINANSIDPHAYSRMRADNHRLAMMLPLSAQAEILLRHCAVRAAQADGLQCGKLCRIDSVVSCTGRQAVKDHIVMLDLKACCHTAAHWHAGFGGLL